MMQTFSFNLVEEPWIPCVRDDGKTPMRPTVLVAAALLAAAPPAAAGAADAGSGAIKVTPEKEKICAAADERYKALFPDAKDDGAVVVKLHKYTFCPPNLKVKVGTTVRWVNVDKRTSHSVWLKEAGIKESERFFPEERWEFTFAAPGKYPYLCGPHWQSEGMRGFVEVTP